MDGRAVVIDPAANPILVADRLPDEFGRAVAEAVAQLLQTACDENGPDKDLTTVVQPVERRAGVEVRAPRASGPLPK